MQMLPFQLLTPLYNTISTLLFSVSKHHSCFCSTSLHKAICYVFFPVCPYVSQTMILSYKSNHICFIQNHSKPSSSFQSPSWPPLYFFNFFHLFFLPFYDLLLQYWLPFISPNYCWRLSYVLCFNSIQIPLKKNVTIHCLYPQKTYLYDREKGLLFSKIAIFH
jgi:hypothetical protein